MRIKIIAAGLLVAGAATWIWQSGATRSNVKRADPQVLSERANPSPEASSSPLLTPTPTVHDSTTSQHTDATDVTVSNQSSQSGSGTNHNSTSTNITVNGEHTSVQSTTVNGHTTTTVSH